MTTPGPEPTTPNIARTYDHLLGGTENFAVDRAFAAELVARFPGTLDVVSANREFLAYGVQRALEGGVRQFLDVGSGLPTGGNTHQIAAEAGEGPVRVVYVDNDEVAVAHSAELVAGLPNVHAIMGDAADPAGVLAAAEALPEAGRLNLAAPVAVIMCCVLHFVARPVAEVLADYLAALAPGSILIMTHGTGDGEMLARTARQYREAGLPAHVRSPAELTEALAGWHVRAPGLARVEDVTAAAAGIADIEAAPGWLAAVIADKPFT